MNYLDYELEFNGIKYIKYPASYPKRLVITFAAREKIYNRLKEFWGEWDNTEYIFFNDKIRYYETHEEVDWFTEYDHIINHVMTGFDKENTTFIGSSMGCFGALYHGFKFKVANLVVCAPQAPPLTFALDYTPATQNHLWEELQKRMIECDKLPKLYIECSGHEPDFTITEKIILHYFRNGGKFICHTEPNDKRHYPLRLGIHGFAMKVMNFLNNWTE